MPTPYFSMKVVGPSEKVLLINEVGIKGRVVSGLVVVSKTSVVDVVEVVDVVVVVFDEVSETCGSLQLIMKDVAAITATTAELFIF